MDRQRWTKLLREAERELEAATKRTDVDAAAKRLMRAKSELKALEQATASRAASRRALRLRAKPPRRPRTPRRQARSLSGGLARSRAPVRCDPWTEIHSRWRASA